MLFMHEVHEVIGGHEAEFEAAYRDEWMPLLAKDGDARLLWYLNHAMGSGPSYQVVTVTAVRDGAAWDRLVDRLLEGDLQEWSQALDSHRYRTTGKLLLPVHWSPLQAVDLADVPVDGSEHDLSIYMEDTGWPDVALDDYIDYWDEHYFQFMRRLPVEHQLLQIQACFQTGYGSHVRPEAILMQKIVDPRALAALLSTKGEYDPDEWPGSYMYGALELRDQWESKLLRTSAWSPWY